MTLAHCTSTRELRTKFGNPSRTNVVKGHENGARLFYSYGKLIAAEKGGEVHLTGYWDASATTNFYRIQFTGLNTAETRKAIASGEMRVMNSGELEQWAREV